MKKVSLVPFYKEQEKNKIFIGEDRDEILEPYKNLKEYFEKRNYSLNTNDINLIEESDYIILLNFDYSIIKKLYRLNKLKNSIYLQYEPPVVIPFHREIGIKIISKIFGKVLSWNDDLVGVKNNIFKFNYPIPKEKESNKIEFKNKKFICNISGNKESIYKNELYSERIKAIKYFEGKEINFDLYGMNWSSEKYSSYKGKIENKNEILKKYKFSLCYENMTNIKGYITEKIFDCLYARVVPIYYGADNIEEYVPKECFIDFREYKNYDKLYEKLKNMSEKEYENKIKAIDKYLKSEQYRIFSADEFSKNVFSRLTEENSVKYSKLESIIGMIELKIFQRYLKLEKKLIKLKRKVIRWIKR